MRDRYELWAHHPIRNIIVASDGRSRCGCRGLKSPRAGEDADLPGNVCPVQRIVEELFGGILAKCATWYGAPGADGRPNHLDVTILHPGFINLFSILRTPNIKTDV